VRRWICIAFLLAGFSRQDYVYAARAPRMTPTEQPLDRMPAHHPETQPWTWWLRP
jgi:hypothetical protein